MSKSSWVLKKEYTFKLPTFFDMTWSRKFTSFINYLKPGLSKPDYRQLQSIVSLYWIVQFYVFAY